MKNTRLPGCRALAAWLMAAAAVGGAVGAAPAAAAKPNIVVFFSDDHGQLDSTVYGARDVRTPNMQKLAEDGVVFTHAFVASPSCAPSRAAMLTGLMPARNGAEANHTYARDGIKALPAYLQELGYEVAAFGKVAHGRDAERRGFDHHDRAGNAGAVGRYLEGRDGAKPLCLLVGTHQPHVPWPEIDGYDPAAVNLPPSHADTPQTRDFRARYYTDVAIADAELGEIRALAREKLGRDALFVYTSDHGGQWPFGKWTLYDAGIRVPFIASWPGVIEPGTTADAMISWIDLLPTFIELAGGTPPRDLDGRSFAAVLRGKARAHRERIFSTHSGDGRMNVFPIRAVRTREWKYIRNLHPEFRYHTHIDLAQAADGGFYWKSWEEGARSDSKIAAVVERYHRRPAEELYDLRRDPFELRNLAGDAEHAGRLAKFRAEIDAWMEEQGDEGTVYGPPRRLSDPPPEAGK